MFPFDISEDRTGPEPSVLYATYTEKIELNVPMDDALFATPAGADAPPKSRRGRFKTAMVRFHARARTNRARSDPANRDATSGFGFHGSGPMRRLRRAR